MNATTRFDGATPLGRVRLAARRLPSSFAWPGSPRSRALAISLLLHGALVSVMLSSGLSAEHGAAGGKPRAVEVRMLQSSVTASAAPAVSDPRPAPSLDPAEATHDDVARGNAPSGDPGSERLAAPDAAEPSSPPVHSPYFDRGRLTRLPAPIGDIALDDDAIAAVPVSATVLVTLLVKADGAVADATARIDGASEGDVREFVDRVLARLRDTRFQPGEIDGAAVPSRLDIVVVGRPIDAARP